jgi:hypothetical protein
MIAGKARVQRCPFCLSAHQYAGAPCLSGDGRQLATAGADGTIRTYTLMLDELTALAEARLTRSLADEECRKFLRVATCP